MCVGGGHMRSATKRLAGLLSSRRLGGTDIKWFYMFSNQCLQPHSVKFRFPSPTDTSGRSHCVLITLLLEILLILNHCLVSGSKLSGPSFPHQPSCGSETGGKGLLPSLPDLVWFHPPWVASARQVVSMETACPSPPSSDVQTHAGHLHC